MNAAIISAVAALIGVALGQLLARGSENRKWLRTEQHKAAAELLATGEAIRRHRASRILDGYACTVRPDLADVYLADLERLDLALEAARTVFPADVAGLAERFAEAVVGIARSGYDQVEKLPSPGDRYFAARSSFTKAARHLMAPTISKRLWVSRNSWTGSPSDSGATTAVLEAARESGKDADA